MVCLLDEVNVRATVRDTTRISRKHPLRLNLYPGMQVRLLFSNVSDHFGLELDRMELTLQDKTHTDPIVLNPHMEKTLSDVPGMNFDPDSSVQIIIAPLKTKNMTLHVQGSYDDDLLLGASASPTTADLPPASPAPAAQPLALMSVEHYCGSQAHSSTATVVDACKYVGLVNQAMTCYLNSLLQALYMTPEFRNALYNWEFDGSNPNNSIPFQLQRLFLNLQTSVKSAVETTDLTHSFGWNMQQAWEQHDIQELCRVMFDALEQKFKDTKQANLINDLYEGKMLDYVKCLECSTEKSREDTFQDIPLPVRPFGSKVAYNSVEEALRAFVQPETLEGSNQYFCEKCNKKCDAHKGLKFTKFPYLLTLHLKRFDFDYSTMNRIKLNDKVVFSEKLNLNSFIPTNHTMSEDALEERETIVKCDDCSTTDSGSALDDESCQGTDISSTVNGPEDNCQDDDEGIDVSSGTNHHENEKNRLQEPKGPYIYELFSIMIHSGSASGGHYYAYIKDFSKNQWFCFNDQIVNPVTEDDIHKTYGGGPQRGYYSGAYTSSTNAYMLMYRRIDAERNCEALAAAEFPPHIKQLLIDMREKEESDRLKKEQESDTYKIKIYCQHPAHSQMVEEKMFVFSDTSLSEATEDAYEKLKLKDIVRLEDCRLVIYNKSMETVVCSLENTDSRFNEITMKDTEFLLDIKKPDEPFEEYKLGGVSMKVYLINIETEEVDNPDNIWVNADWSVQDLKARLTDLYKLETVHVVQETYSNQPHYLENEEASLKFDPRCNGYKLYVSNAIDLESPEKPFTLSKLASIIDRFVHVIMLDIVLPDTEVGTLELLSIPSLDVNQNCDRIELGGSGDRASNSSSLRVSPQPGPGNCELFGDQSNSEDSSLSESDRTLVCEAPGDNVAILSSSSNSPADQPMASPTEVNDIDYPANYYDLTFSYKSQEEMIWDDEESPSAMERAAMNSYYFKAQLPKRQDESSDTKCCRIQIDKRTNLGRLKKHLEPIIGVPVEYFKIYRQYPNQDVEWSTVKDTLGSLKDGERLIVKLGRVLKDNEVSGKIYYLQPESPEFVTFWFEWIIAKDQTVASVKREILLQAKKQFMVDIPFNRCCLRKKNLKNPTKIYLDDEKFCKDIVVTNTFELYIQRVIGAEKVSASQLMLFVRRWRPDTLSLDPFQEVVIEKRSVEELKAAISELSGLPLEFIDIAYLKFPFPCDMNILEIHTKLGWNPDSPSLDSYPLFYDVYDDGCIFYYRDSRESLKELTVDERKELNQSENKRLGKNTKKTCSPRRERGLKIYVDTSPKKEDKVFTD